MKRFVAFCGICLVLLGIRVGNSVILELQLPYQASLSVYQSFRPTTTMPYSTVGIKTDLGKYYALRIDTIGNKKTIESILEQLQASTLQHQIVSGVQLWYAYSPLLNIKKILQGKKINVMIALSNNNIALGYPLLVGSY
ncbi:MAG: hypothetical protein FWF56_06580 [Firmicutes bacterium]|nr:hypothetical protein [Bacillota bacterium]MCL1953588.1 hypothetical protein [Bacillota bacterium]